MALARVSPQPSLPPARVTASADAGADKAPCWCLPAARSCAPRGCSRCACSAAALPRCQRCGTVLRRARAKSCAASARCGCRCVRGARQRAAAMQERASPKNRLASCQAISAPERTTATPGASSSVGNGNGNGIGGVALMKMGTGSTDGLTSVGALVSAENDGASAFGDGTVVAESPGGDWSRFKGYSTFKARLPRPLARRAGAARTLHTGFQRPIAPRRARSRAPRPYARSVRSKSGASSSSSCSSASRST